MQINEPIVWKQLTNIMNNNTNYYCIYFLMPNFPVSWLGIIHTLTSSVYFIFPSVVFGN